MRQLLLAVIVICASSPAVSGQSDLSQSPEARIEQAALAALTDRFAVRESEIELRVDQYDVELADGDSLNLRFSDRSGVPTGRTHARLLTRNREQRWRESGWALLFVSTYDSVLVSQESVRAEEEITPDQIETIWTEVTQFSSEPLTPETYRQLHAEEGCVARQYIRKGEILRRDAVRRPYAARAGTSLLMIYERNGISAHLRCRARQSGMTGEIIRVSCPSTGSLYRVQLEENGTTTWVETL